MPKNRAFPVEFQVRAGKIPKIVGRIPYNSRSEFMGFFEILRPGCFTRAIKKAKKILSLWNHDSSKPLANSANGSLVLKDSPTALYVEIKPDPTISWAADAIKAVRRGDLGGLSFGFSLPADGSGVEYNGDVREITEVDKLFEVSPCVFPSYSESSVALRNNKTRKRGKKMSKYSLAEIRRITKEMESAEGADLIDLGAEYDEIAPVVIPDSPAFADVGLRGLQAYLGQSAGDQYRTPVDRQDTRGGPFKSFGEQLVAIRNAGSPGGQTDPRLFQVRAASGLSEGSPSDGGFLLQDNFSTEILQTAWNDNEILKRIRLFHLSGNANGIKIPGVDETSRANGSRNGGIQSYWTGEAGEFTATKPKFRLINLQCNKLTGLCYATDELMEDANALGNFIKQAFLAEIDFKIADAIINGSGAGMPLGVLASDACVTISPESGQSSESVIFENISKMWTRLFASSRKDAVWLISQTVENQLHQLSIAVGTGGVACYLPAGGLSVGGYNTLFGRPVIPVSQMPVLGTKGDILLGNFKNGYIGCDRGAPQTDMSIHIRFEFGENCYRFQYRFDGQPVLQSPVTPFVGTDTNAHFCVISDR